MVSRERTKKKNLIISNFRTREVKRTNVYVNRMTTKREKNKRKGGKKKKDGNQPKEVRP